MAEWHASKARVRSIMAFAKETNDGDMTWGEAKRMEAQYGRSSAARYRTARQGVVDAMDPHHDASRAAATANGTMPSPEEYGGRLGMHNAGKRVDQTIHGLNQGLGGLGDLFISGGEYRRNLLRTLPGQEGKIGADLYTQSIGKTVLQLPFILSGIGAATTTKELLNGAQMGTLLQVKEQLPTLAYETSRDPEERTKARLNGANEVAKYVGPQMLLGGGLGFQGAKGQGAGARAAATVKGLGTGAAGVFDLRSPGVEFNWGTGRAPRTSPGQTSPGRTWLNGQNHLPTGASGGSTNGRGNGPTMNQTNNGPSGGSTSNPGGGKGTTSTGGELRLGGVRDPLGFERLAGPERRLMAQTMREGGTRPFTRVWADVTTNGTASRADVGALARYGARLRTTLAQAPAGSPQATRAGAELTRLRGVLTGLRPATANAAQARSTLLRALGGPTP